MSPSDSTKSPPEPKAKPKAVRTTKAAPVATVEAAPRTPSKLRAGKPKPESKPKAEPKLKAEAPPKPQPKRKPASKPEAALAPAAEVEPKVQLQPDPDPVAKPAPVAPAAAPVKHSAMKLPAGFVPKFSRGPQGRRSWETGGGGKPQRDAARRAGKSRKVH